MKAAVYTRYGPPDVVQIQDVEQPEPSDNEVLLAVRAAAVDPLDMVIKGRPYIARFMTGLRTPRVTRVGVDVAAYTALQGLRDKGQLQPGQTVLINGAAGGVRTFAVQIAKAFGAAVTGVVR